MSLKGLNHGRKSSTPADWTPEKRFIKYEYAQAQSPSLLPQAGREVAATPEERSQVRDAVGTLRSSRRSD